MCVILGACAGNLFDLCSPVRPEDALILHPTPGSGCGDATLNCSQGIVCGDSAQSKRFDIIGIFGEEHCFFFGASIVCQRWCELWLCDVCK